MLPFFNVLFVAVFAMDIRLLLLIIKLEEEEEEEEEGGQGVLSTLEVAFFELYTQIRLT